MRWIFSMLLVAAGARAADVELVPVTAFGQSLDGCQVKSVKSTEVPEKPEKDYAAQFQGLIGKDIPAGAYIFNFNCGSEGPGFGFAKVEDMSGYLQPVVVPRFERQMRSDPPPSLRITLKSPPQAGETWWLRTVNVYMGAAQTSRFSPGAALVDPDPGRYLVEIRSSTGYRCTRLIDLVEWTKKWTFDAPACTFELDHWAHLVDDSSKSDWYDQMQHEREELDRALEKAAENSKQ